MNVHFQGSVIFFLYAWSLLVKWASKRLFAEALHVLRLNCSLRCKKKRKKMCACYIVKVRDSTSYIHRQIITENLWMGKCPNEGEIRKLLQLSSNFLTLEWVFIGPRGVLFLVTFLVRGSTVLVHMNHADVLWNTALGGIYCGSILLI